MLVAQQALQGLDTGLILLGAGLHLSPTLQAARGV